MALPSQSVSQSARGRYMYRRRRRHRIPMFAVIILAVIACGIAWWILEARSSEPALPRRQRQVPRLSPRGNGPRRRQQHKPRSSRPSLQLEPQRSRRPFAVPAPRMEAAGNRSARTSHLLPRTGRRFQQLPRRLPRLVTARSRPNRTWSNRHGSCCPKATP